MGANGSKRFSAEWLNNLNCLQNTKYEGFSLIIHIHSYPTTLSASGLTANVGSFVPPDDPPSGLFTECAW